MTRYTLQALRMSGVPPSDEIFTRARVFVERCQNFDPDHPNDADGGFFFSTVVLDANKAGMEGKRYRSYGTTTADGIQALFAIGLPLHHERVRAAQRWLMSHHIANGAPGFTGEPYQRWTTGLRFYYAGASTDAFHALGVPVAPPMAPDLMRSQRVDGSWANPENLVKEDDPLIATACAVRALAPAPQE